MTGHVSTLSMTARLWGYRDLVRALVARNLRLRYQRSVLGLGWSLLYPGLTIAVLVLVFQYVIRIGVDQYWAFLLSGYFGWVFLLHTLGAATSVFGEHASLLRTIAVPPEVLVVGAVVSRFVEFVVELVLVAAILAWFRHGGIPASYAVLPVAVLTLFFTVLALALPVAAAAAFFRDVTFALPALLTLAGYLSPVYYPVTMVPAAWQGLFQLNPFAQILGLFHACLYDGRVPPSGQVVISMATSMVMLGVGVAVFRWKRHLLPEVV